MELVLTDWRDEQIRRHRRREALDTANFFIEKVLAWFATVVIAGITLGLIGSVAIAVASLFFGGFLR